MSYVLGWKTKGCKPLYSNLVFSGAASLAKFDTHRRKKINYPTKRSRSCMIKAYSQPKIDAYSVRTYLQALLAYLLLQVIGRDWKVSTIPRYRFYARVLIISDSF